MQRFRQGNREGRRLLGLGLGFAKALVLGVPEAMEVGGSVQAHWPGWSASLSLYNMRIMKCHQ